MALKSRPRKLLREIFSSFGELIRKAPTVTSDSTLEKPKTPTKSLEETKEIPSVKSGSVKSDSLTLDDPRVLRPKQLSNLTMLRLMLSVLTKGKIKMNSEQIKSAIRWIVSAAAGFFIGKGIGDAVLWEAVAGAATLVVPAVWSYFTHKKV